LTLLTVLLCVYGSTLVMSADNSCLEHILQHHAAAAVEPDNNNYSSIIPQIDGARERATPLFVKTLRSTWGHGD